MRVRIVSFGTNWWSPHPRDLSDPYCFRRRAVWFNSAGLKYGRRLYLCWIWPGHVRFNQRSGFHPEFRQRSVGKVFLSPGPANIQGRSHLLFSCLLKDARPDYYLVTVNATVHGPISFASRSWKSSGVLPVSISLRKDRYEAMVLMAAEDWIQSDLGFWMVSADGSNVRLASPGRGETV